MKSEIIALLLKLPINVSHVAGACNEIAFSLIPLIRIAAIIGRSRNHVGH